MIDYIDNPSNNHSIIQSLNQSINQSFNQSFKYLTYPLFDQTMDNPFLFTFLFFFTPDKAQVAIFLELVIRWKVVNVNSTLSTCE